MCDSPQKKYTVPFIWDTREKTIVSNESSEIIMMLNSAFNEFAKNPEADYAPAELTEQAKEVDEWIYHGINNGVYKCGFAKTQAAYDEATENLSAALDKLEAHLEGKKYVLGDKLTLSDIRLFVTLIRYDEVYVVYFKTNTKQIADYPNIFKYCAELWKIPEVVATTNMRHIKVHYFTSHATLNAYAIVPKGPNFIGKLEAEIASQQ